MSALVYSVPGQSEGRRNHFLEWASIDLFLNYVNYYKSIHHPIPTLPVAIGNTQAMFKNQLALLSIKCPGMVSSVKGRVKSFWGYKKGGYIVRLSPREFSYHKKWKSISFREIWNNPTPPLLFVKPPYKWALQDMELYDKFVDRFQDLSKVKNPAVSKAEG